MAVTGGGGCACVSAGGRRDAIGVEGAGVPSIALIHNAMGGSAKAMKRLSGVPDYEFVTVDYPHIPTGVWTADEVKEIAKEVTPFSSDYLTHS